MNAFRKFFPTNRRVVIILALFTLALIAVAPVGAKDVAGASPQPLFFLAQLSLDLNLDPLWTSVNTYFPIFLGIVAIGGGIAIAIAIANFVIKALLGAFKGGGR